MPEKNHLGRPPHIRLRYRLLMMSIAHWAMTTSYQEVICLDRMKTQLKVLALLSVIGGVLFPMACLFDLHAKTKERLLFCLIFSSAIFLFLCGTLVREWSQYQTAKLIVENQLFYARIAEVPQSGTLGCCFALPAETIEVYISCFGVLLDNRVIKYNLRDRKLQEVVIGKDWIRLIFHKGKDVQTLQILHPVLEDKEFETLAKRFYHETGIRPVRDRDWT